MLAMAVHFTGIVTLTNYRNTLYDAAVPKGVSASDASVALASLNVSLALTYLCIAVSAFAFLTARTVRMEAVNFLSCAGHTIAGVLLLVIWLQDAHMVRIWHVFFVFTMVPALLEFIGLVMTRVRGEYLW